MKFLLVLVALVASVFTEDIEGCKGVVNENPVIKQEPKLISEVSNGQKYLIQQGDNIVYFANVTGSAYEMGYASGKLMGEEMKANIQNMNGYITEGFRDALTGLELPKFIVNIIAESIFQLFEGLLWLNFIIAEKFIPERYIQEMQGIADASGIDYSDIRNMNMIPELIKAACTIAGTWSKATVDSKLLTLRALDWESSAPINQYPLITVYHSTEEGSFPFANVGYAGLIGSITALGSQGVSISEKVWLPRDAENYPTTYFGKPWTFVMRDLAQFEVTLDNMIEKVFDTHRTCRIHMGLASAESNTFEGLDYSWKVVNVYNDHNYTYYDPIAHPELEGVVFFDKHVQPSQDPCTGQVLKTFWGEIDTEVLYRQVGGLSKTGDTQICVADVQQNTIWLSYSGYGSNIPAYERSPMFIDLKPFYGL